MARHEIKFGDEPILLKIATIPGPYFCMLSMAVAAFCPQEVGMVARKTSASAPTSDGSSLIAADGEN